MERDFPVCTENEPFNESINSSMQEEFDRLTTRVIDDIDAHKGNEAFINSDWLTQKSKNMPVFGL